MPELANPKHERLCQEYLIDLNQTEAAKRAKYSAHTAAQQASRLFTNVKIQARIAELKAIRNERTRVTQDRVVKELAMLGFSDLQNYITIDPLTGAIQAKGFEDMPPSESRALKAIKEDRAIKEDADGKGVTVYDKVSFTMHDKIRALEILARHLGMLVERHELMGDGGGPIKIEYVLVKQKKRKRGGDGKGDGK
jgi:phage terminase small subunit